MNENSKSSIRIIPFLALMLFALNMTGLAQSSGDYRSKVSGSWNDVSTWETYNGTTWVSATQIPQDWNIVEIQATHIINSQSITNRNSITVNGKLNVNGDFGSYGTITVGSLGSIGISSNLTNGMLNNNGTVIVTGTYTTTNPLTNSGTVIIGSTFSGKQVTNNSNGTINVTGAFTTDSPLTNNGTIILESTFYGKQVTNSNTGTINVTGAFTTDSQLTNSGLINLGASFQGKSVENNTSGTLNIIGNFNSDSNTSNSGIIRVGGNYTGTGITSQDESTFLISGNATTNGTVSVAGNLLISGSYNSGGFSLNGDGMLAVGQNLTLDNKSAQLTGTSRLLVLGNYNALNWGGITSKSTESQVAVLGEIIITPAQNNDELGCTSDCSKQSFCTTCLISDFIDPTHPDWILPEGITSFWWEDFNSNAIGDNTEGTKWNTTLLDTSRASVQNYSSSNTNHVLYFDPATNVTGTIWETEEIPTNCYKKITISAYLFQEKNNGQGNAFFEYKANANGTWQTIVPTSNGLCQIYDIQASSIKLRLRVDNIKKNNIIRLDNVGISGTATCGGSATVPSTPGAINGAQAVCASTSGFTYSISPVTNATGYTWQVPSGWTINTGIGTTTITVTSGTTGGTITVTADNSHGSSNPQTKTVTVTATNTASNASATPTVCINTAFTPITHTTTGATGIGTATGLPSGVTASWASNTITISGTPIVSGTFNYSIPLTGGCGTVNATGTIRVNPENTISAPSSTPTICINSALSPITHITTGADGLSSVTGLPPGVTATWASNTITINGTPTASGTFNYAIAVTGGCGSAAAFGTITVIAQPTTATVGSTQNMCGLLTSNALGGNTPAVGTAQWSIVSGGTGTFSNNASGNSVFTANAYGSYVLRWTISNGVCTPSTADITVNFYQTPTTANAGTDQSNCNNSTFTLAGNSPSVGTGLWTVVSGSATISNPNSPASTLTNLAAGNAATLRWTITNGTCSSTDDVTLTNYATPTTANAGTDQSNCNNSNFTLNGNVPTIGTGLWSVVSGSVTITNPGTATSTVTDLAAGTNATLRWTITNGACSSADDVILTNYATPTTATVGATQNICEILVSNTLNGNTALVGTSTWTIVSGGTGTFSAENSGSSTFTADNHGTYVLRWTISNGICTPSTADITVNFYAKPTTASISATKVNYIETLTTTTLGGNTPIVGTGAWSITNGSAGTFSLQNQGNSTFTANDIGDYTLTWKITNGTCSSTADIITHFYTDTRWNGTNSPDWATALN